MSDSTPFEKRTREVLEESAARLDGRTRSRLTRARHAALEQAARPQRLSWRMYVPAGAAAAVAVLAVMLYTRNPVVENPVVAERASAADDMEQLADVDAPDFAADDGEDPEFYEWAAGEVES